MTVSSRRCREPKLRQPGHDPSHRCRRPAASAPGVHSLRPAGRPARTLASAGDALASAGSRMGDIRRAGRSRLPVDPLGAVTASARWRCRLQRRIHRALSATAAVSRLAHAAGAIRAGRSGRTVQSRGVRLGLVSAAPERRRSALKAPAGQGLSSNASPSW